MSTEAYDNSGQVCTETCDSAIEIPQFGTKHSFNITVSLGIVLWDHLIKTTKAHKEKGA